MSSKIAVLLAAGAVVACGLPFVAAAQSGPVWVEAPTVADIAAAYPAKAKAANLGGTVMLTCEIGHDQHPRDCATLKEKPELYGFAPAALKLVEKLKVDTASMNGQNIFIPVTFDPAVLTGNATVTKPAWVEAPSVQDFQATFPKSQNGVNDVRVVLGCTVQADGGLGGCAVAQETPPGQGYGDGALALAAKFRMSPWSMDGAPTVGAKIKLPIHYVLTPVKPPPQGKQP
ncbi:MAG TPA: energy transducer TonB [Phenylobacterium sp.]|jgi:hypothetical protein|uniref:energy transducer TonB n=1 Tax=Phenylobacterium sp. TaxID=1871053 RepID=UPI002D34B5C3|nr:energy transducer TonB [Phenylobacterium sp.]HZZ70408.1 energy transducer TonB [Phenylobacterium sp.]